MQTDPTLRNTLVTWRQNTTNKRFILNPDNDLTGSHLEKQSPHRVKAARPRRHRAQETSLQPPASIHALLNQCLLHAQLVHRSPLGGPTAPTAAQTKRCVFVSSDKLIFHSYAQKFKHSLLHYIKKVKTTPASQEWKKQVAQKALETTRKLKTSSIPTSNFT